MISATKEFTRFLWKITEGRLLAGALLTIVAGMTEGLSLVMLIPILAATGPGGSRSVHVPLIGNALQRLSPQLWAILALFTLLVVLQAALSKYKTTYTNAMMLRATERMRLSLFESVGMAKWEAIVTRRATDINHILGGECTRIMIAAGNLISLFQAFTMLVIYLALAALVSFQMALLAIAIGLALFMLLYPMRRRASSFGHELSKLHERENHTTLEFIHGLRLAKLFVVERNYVSLLAQHLGSARRGLENYVSLTSNGTFFFQVSSAIAAASFVWVAVNEFALGTARIVGLLLIFIRLAPRFNLIQSTSQQFLNNVPAYTSYREAIDFFSAHREPEVDTARPAPVLHTELRFDNVGLVLGDNSRSILDNVDFIVKARRATALIGPSGSGKSTIADVMLGLTQPTTGVLRVDGVALTDTERRAWRGSVAAVPQDPFLFNDTLAANLRIARPDADDAELWGALERASLAELVHALPDQLHTQAGERGARFSGGERQRIAFARALLRRPQLLVLDEATSALDWDNQRKIAEVIESLRGDLTIVTIAHRPSMIAFADDVVAIVDGRIVETGSFAALAEQKNSVLAKMLRNDGHDAAAGAAP